MAISAISENMCDINPYFYLTPSDYLYLLYGKHFSGYMEQSDWLVFGWDFTLQTITMETVRSS